MADIVQTTPDLILDSILTRLRTEIKDVADDGAAFISDEPFPDVSAVGPPGVEMVTVSLDSGTFDDAMFTGGGAATLCDQTAVIVTWFSRIQLDSPGHQDEAMLNPKLGLITKRMPQIIRALTANDWEPTDSSGNNLLRNQLRPHTRSKPGRWTEGKSLRTWWFFHVVFATDFDWDMG